MSTYLKSAAMSLLSKTLQTFLTKYLSDVDVEGVTLPSYDGSGWGVRLSNVQLREGVQLMENMPGGVKKKRIVKRRHKRRRRIPRQNTTTESGSSPRNVLSDNSGSNETGDYGARRTRTNSALTTQDLEITATSAADYYTDEELEFDGDGNPGPSTPVQKSNSMFACFYNRNATRNDADAESNKLNSDSMHKGQEQQKENLDEEAKGVASGGNIDDKSGATILLSSIPSGEASLVRKSAMGNGDFTENSDKSKEDEEYDYEYYEEEEDCEEEYELPLRLCLGEDGRIGTIDVRLIGKELHIMLEDAVITIEAIPIIPKDNGSEKNKAQEKTNGVIFDESQPSDSGNDNTTISNNSTEANINGDANNTVSANAKKEASKPKPEPKRDTVYDRVLADNGLARIISAIPHLFLRDIRVRMIVRNEPMRTTFDEEEKNSGDSTNTSSNATSNHFDGYTKPNPSSKDTMVEVGIDFLSVTSGEDILSHFQQEHTASEEELMILNNSNLDGTNHSKRSISTTDSTSTKPPTLLKIPSNIVDANGEEKNEYLVRHVRTGRGPSAGIYVQIFAPNSNLSKIVTRSTASSGIIWARQHWISATKNYLLKCSGVDIQSRIHMGTKRVDAGYSWFYGEYVDDYDENSEIDSLILFGGGLDTIAPGPQLPLPRIEPSAPSQPRMSRGSTPGRNRIGDASDNHGVAERTEPYDRKMNESSIDPGVDVYSVDANGIQSCKVPSIFHRVSRGMELKSCKDCKHLPSEVCDLCWEVPLDSDVTKDSPLDSSIPMPGLVLQISVRDPLEINVDRNNIESIGLIKSLFTKPSNPDTIKDNDQNKDSTEGTSNTETTAATSHSEDTTQATTASTGFFSGLLYGKQEEKIPEEDIQMDSFENYMQPESISVMGIYFAEAIVRVHVMGEDQNDTNLSFCYWQIDVNCLTFDRQALSTPQKSFSDLELDIGQLVWDEYQGTCRKNVASLGAHQFFKDIRRSDSQASFSSMIDDQARNKVPWPSTACALLDITPPLESLVYKSREGHGLQLRFVSTPSSTASNIDVASRSLMHLRLGLTTVDASWDIKNDITQIVREMVRNVSGPRENSSEKAENDGEEVGNAQKDGNGEVESNETVEQVEPKFLMTYTIQVDSGNISLPPLIQSKMPLTRVFGERSSLAGFSIGSVLGKVDFAYGSKEPPKRFRRCLSLPQIASLPEHVRMHILLCLEDTSALEKALNIKKESNSFRRLKAVDKVILKMAKKISKRSLKITSKKKLSDRPHSVSSREDSLVDSANRRQNILTEIMKLDDSELSSLWSVHQRYQKKLAKKLQEERNQGKLRSTLSTTKEK
eukprot:jgi/Psemu1/225816/e_gw1.1672.29.1